MQVISKLHPDLLKILNEFSDFFYGRDYSHLEPIIETIAEKRKINRKKLNKEAVSIEYLQAAMKAPPLEYGFPRHSWGLEMAHDSSYISDHALLDRCRKTNDKLMNFFGARNNALQMFYPSGGFIGWHTNCNAPGYNIILSCNPEANGYFDHYDHINGKLNRMQDQTGWNCKVGYFGRDTEPEKMYWHCAYTDSPRVTMSYVIYDKNLWEDMVADIDYGD